LSRILSVTSRPGARTVSAVRRTPDCGTCR